MQNGDSSTNAPTNAGVVEKQSEWAGENAEIIHPDGRRETVQIAVGRSWSGALPRPEDFGQYGEILPDAPERLLRMLELEQQHRIAMERQLVPAEIAAGARGAEIRNSYLYCGVGAGGRYVRSRRSLASKCSTRWGPRLKRSAIFGRGDQEKR